MNVVITEQSLKSLEISLRFYLEELQIPKSKVVKMKNRLLGKAKNLSKNPLIGQYEPYLSKLK